MGYGINTKINPAIEQREREMLLAGFSYAEIAKATGARHRTIAERNRVIYRINIQDAFARRVERDGIPNRLNVSDAFGYWFSGLFDGEGHIGAFSRPRHNGYPERRLTIQVQLRDDDAQVIERIHDNLKIGATWRVQARPNGNGHPSIGFRVEQVEDLAEVVVPLFDRYPLHSKKAREFAIWRNLVRSQYTVTMGGYSQRTACSDEQNAAFDAGVQAIKEIRTWRA